MKRYIMWGPEQGSFCPRGVWDPAWWHVEPFWLSNPVLQSPSFWVYMESSLYRHDWLNCWPLVFSYKSQYCTAEADQETCLYPPEVVLSVPSVYFCLEVPIGPPAYRTCNLTVAQYKWKFMTSYSASSKKVLWKVPIQKVIFFLLLSLACFYLLPNVILSKEKINFKIVVWILPLIFILCDASFKCKYKNIQLICRITEITQSIAHMCIQIPFLPG